MSDIRVASRYAKSLIELAIEKNVLEEVHNDMQLFASTVNSNRELLMLLKNPIVRNDKKLNVLKGIFGEKVSGMTMEFFKIASRKKRESHLPAVASEFEALYRINKGIVKAEVVTAFPIPAEMRKQFEAIVASLTSKKPDLTERVDKSIIGGYILRVGDRQIDESIQSKLEELRSEFSRNPYVKAY
jgi:F-type H+-transporting ATPase subunit delta